MHCLMCTILCALIVPLVEGISSFRERFWGRVVHRSSVDFDSTLSGLSRATAMAKHSASGEFCSSLVKVTSVRLNSQFCSVINGGMADTKYRNIQQCVQSDQ